MHDLLGSRDERCVQAVGFIVSDYGDRGMGCRGGDGHEVLRGIRSMLDENTVNNGSINGRRICIQSRGSCDTVLVIYR